MLNTHRNKTLVGLGLVALIAFGSFSFQNAPQPEHKGFQNLKVLPKDIDHMALIKIMHDFRDALGFKCSDCHAASKTKPGDLDFASDAKPEKETAREMMRMVKKINKKFFKVKGSFADSYLQGKYDITCYTCHHGDEHPKTAAPERKKGEE